MTCKLSAIFLRNTLERRNDLYHLLRKFWHDNSVWTDLTARRNSGYWRNRYSYFNRPRGCDIILECGDNGKYRGRELCLFISSIFTSTSFTDSISSNHFHY